MLMGVVEGVALLFGTKGLLMSNKNCVEGEEGGPFTILAKKLIPPMGILIDRDRWVQETKIEV